MVTLCSIKNIGHKYWLDLGMISKTKKTGKTLPLPPLGILPKKWIFVAPSNGLHKENNGLRMSWPIPPPVSRISLFLFSFFEFHSWSWSLVSSFKIYSLCLPCNQSWFFALLAIDVLMFCLNFNLIQVWSNYQSWFQFRRWCICRAINHWNSMPAARLSHWKTLAIHTPPTQPSNSTTSSSDFLFALSWWI